MGPRSKARPFLVQLAGPLMNPIDRKRAKLFAIGEELRDNHRSGACGRRGCTCLAKYETTRKQYLKLIDGYEEAQEIRNSRRRGRE
jgi:hypothetical protein